VLSRPGARMDRHRSDGVVTVVLNWNGWSDTVECLESLVRAATTPSQIVVCDNGSIDGSLVHIQRWADAEGIAHQTFHAAYDAFVSEASTAALILIQNGDNRGFAAGNNIGIRYACERLGAEFVWMLNNDAVVDSRALERMLEVADCDPEIAMVGSKLVRYEAPHTIQALGGGYILPVICHDTQLEQGKTSEATGTSPIRLDHLIGASVLVRATAVDDVGLMDESYFLYREETDWCIRMRQHGWKLYCCPTATVWHKQSRSVGFKSPLHDYYAVRNVLRLVKKFYPASLPTAMMYYALRSVAPKLVRLEFARLRAVLWALADFVCGVAGRSERHTDSVLLGQYSSQTPPAVAQHRRAALPPGQTSSLLTVLLVLLLAAAIATKMPHHTRIVAIASGVHVKRRNSSRRTLRSRGDDTCATDYWSELREHAVNGMNGCVIHHSLVALRR
jgi:GT2 family glycosyltransferase